MKKLTNDTWISDFGLSLVSLTTRSVMCLCATALAFSCAHGGGDSEKHDEQEAVAKQPISEKPSPDAGASIESKQVAAEANAPFVTEVSFAKGKSTLSREMRARLQKIYEQAEKVGKIGEITSFAWADAEYPGDKQPELPKAAVGLAENRNLGIEATFSSFGHRGTFNKVEMTSRPSGLGAKLGMGDTKMKSLFADAGIQSGTENKRAAPKASKAVVMIVLKK